MSLLVILVLSLMAVASTVALRTVLDRQLSSQLSSMARRAQDLITSRTAPAISQNQLNAAVPVGGFVVCVGPDSEVVTSAVPAGLDARQLLRRVLAAGPEVPVALDSPAGPVRAVLVPVDPRRPLLVTVEGRTRTVSEFVVGFDTSRAEQVVRRTALVEVALIVLAGAVFLLLLPATLERGIRPIRGMTEAARAVAGGDVERRLPADAEVAEAVILARAVNDALDARHNAEARLRQFVADASHELRSPLTTIEGWSELHRQGGLTDPELVDRALDRIAAGASQLTALVEDLALLARLDAGRPVQRAPVDLAALTAAVVDDINVIDPTRTVHTALPPDGSRVATVDGDEQRLRQVVLNLTGNALQHTRRGRPSGSRSSGTATRSSWRSATPAPAYRPSTGVGSSTGSTAWGTPGPAAGPGSGSPSCAASWTRTAGPSRWTPVPGGPASPSPCPPPAPPDVAQSEAEPAPDPSAAPPATNPRGTFRPTSSRRPP